MPPFVYISFGIIALVTIISVAISNRAGGKLLGKEAFAKREARAQLLHQMQALATQIQQEPNSPDIETLRAQYTALSAEYKREADASLADTKSALKPMMQMNYVISGLAGIFALGAIAYLAYSAPTGASRWIYLCFGAFIVLMLVYGALGMLRAKRAWDFATKDRASAEPEGKT